MRRILFGLLLLPTVVLAQPADEWSWGDMLQDDLFPVAIQHSETRFVGLRGEVFASRGVDTLWISTFQPSGPGGQDLPVEFKVDHTPESGTSQMLFTLPRETVGFGNQMFGMTREALTATFGADGLGWRPQERIDPEAGIALTEFHECAFGPNGPVGRAAIVVLQALPDEPGFSFFQLKVIRFDDADCPS